jgi:type IV pilus assembly protein PilP
MEMPKMTANNSIISFGVRLGIIAVAMILTACDNSDLTDLQAYIASVKNRPHEPVKPLPEFKDVEPFVFKREEGLRDPFKPVEKVKAADEEDEEPDNGIRPDANRTKEPLEAFSITGMRMVGTIKMQSEMWGLINNEGVIYRVKVGNHLGKNDGKIVQIDKKKIELIEIMPSKVGRFIEQPTTLMLSE